MSFQEKKQFRILVAVVVGIFLILILRLWYLQIINTDGFRTQSEENRTRYVLIPAERGPLFDRNGDLLVENRPSFNILALRQEVGDREELFSALAKLMGVEAAELEKNWQHSKALPPYIPVLLAEDVGWDTMEKIEENTVTLPGILVEPQPMRAYPHGVMAAHLLGYLGQVTEKELRSPGFEDYYPGAYVGKSGLEKVLDPYLRGSPGEHRIEVDVKGKMLRVLKTREPKPGNRVFLTIRKDLQEAAEKAFGDQAGAAVALDIHSGEVLAMVSRPGFNPAHFARGIRGEEWKKILTDSRHPLQNKAIKGQYPPGSTFKIVTALAALKAGTATPETVVYCPGSVKYGNRRFRCWKRGGHGWTDIRKAVKESCDVYFYKVGYELGIDQLSETAKNLGLGARTGIDLDGEKKGLMPDRDWKWKRFGEKWYDGETVNASIGQGFVLATPIQLAVMTAAVANGGKVMKPYVVSRVEHWSGQKLLENEPTVVREVKFEKRHLKAVSEGLEAAVNERKGTAWTSRLEGVRIAGKTGTAQVVKLKEKLGKNTAEEDIPYRFRDHALFVAYAPVEAPEIAVAVVVEHGSHGGSVAAPITQAIFSHYFGIEVPDEETPPGG